MSKEKKIADVVSEFIKKHDTTLLSSLMENQILDEFIKKDEKPSPDALAPPVRSWTAHRLADGRALVRIIKPVERSIFPEEDPFGKPWDLEIANFLLEFHLKCDMQVQETISAQRISYDDAFAYHIYFEAVERRTTKKCRVFGEVEISRACLSTFVPEVHLCEVIDSARDYVEGCLFCKHWVPHPENMKTVRKEACKDGFHRPRISRMAADLTKFVTFEPVPLGCFHGKAMPKSEFRACMLQQGIPAERLDKLLDD